MNEYTAISLSNDLNYGSEMHHILGEYEYSCDDVDRDEWKRFLETAEISDTYEIHHDVCQCPKADIPYRWTWEDGILTIEVRNDGRGKISRTSVSLPFLQGTWWKPLDDISVTTHGKFMKITARCEHIPLLIRGGQKVDRFSCFFLGMLAMHCDSVRFCIDWLHEAADRREGNAEQILGRVLLEEYPDHAMYWLARCTLDYNDPESTLTLCSLLTNDEDYKNLPLAEYLLAGLANKGNAEALFDLGCFYLNNSEERRKLGIRLLREAARRGVTEARDVLDDVAPVSWTDKLIAAGIGAAAVALGIAYAVKKLKRR